ncbi:hypothetical protein CYMTET_24868 [Cymbomonas tetramitiformis]|uniref:RING-type domain-containing protein n=1 Tax=Cymbomonas tetramitiformis TaxID=36881 RepID=A0AAE0FV07_9CHLO|nr:hypothetical protein CYMTET_24868 [Cymbomonas tetramitiformis]
MNASTISCAAIIQLALIEFRREFYLANRELIVTLVIFSHLLPSAVCMLSGSVELNTEFKEKSMRVELIKGMMIPFVYSFGAFVRVQWLLPRLLLRQIFWPGLDFWQNLETRDVFRMIFFSFAAPCTVYVILDKISFTHFQIAWDRAKFKHVNEREILDRVLGSNLPWIDESCLKIISIFIIRPLAERCMTLAICFQALLASCNGFFCTQCRHWFCRRLRSQLRSERHDVSATNCSGVASHGYTEDMTRDEFDRLCLVCFDRKGVTAPWHKLPRQNCSGNICNVCLKVLVEESKPMSLPCPFCRRVLPPPSHPTHPSFVERDLKWKMAQLNLAGAAQASPSGLPCWLQLCAGAEPWRSAQELADALVSFVEDHERTFRSLCAGAHFGYRELLGRIATLDDTDDTVIMLAACWFTDRILVVWKADCEKSLIIYTSLQPALWWKEGAVHLPWGFSELCWRPLYDWLDALDDDSRERVVFARCDEGQTPEQGCRFVPLR